MAPIEGSRRRSRLWGGSFLSYLLSATRATDDRPYEACVIGVTLTSILIYFRRGGHWPPVEKMQKWATNDCSYEWISRIKGSP